MRVLESGSMSKSCEKLVTWFTQNGGIIGATVEMAWSPELGQHFRTKLSTGGSESDSNGTKLCSCPFTLTLSSHNLISTNNDIVNDGPAAQSACSHLVGKIEDSALGCFFLAEQRALGSTSFWAPYIDLLPDESDMSTPLWFDDEDLLWVLGTNIHASGDDPNKSARMARRQMWQDQHAKGVAILRAQGVDTSAFEWTNLLWAGTIFTSRAFTPKILEADGVNMRAASVLYPVVDALNHKFGAKVLWTMDKGDFTLSTLEKLTPGDQIYNNYAPKGNEELLMGYGFCIPDNPCDQHAIRMSQPPPEVHTQLRQAFPEQFSTPEWSPESSTFYLRGAGHHTGGYKGELQEELPCLRGVPIELFSFICAVHKYNDPDLSEEDLTDARIYAIYARLGMLRQTIRKVDESLPSTPRNERQKHAKIYRDGQLAILDEIIAELSEFLGE